MAYRPVAALKSRLRRLRGRIPVETEVPGREPITLVDYYDELASYYPNCELDTKRWFVDHAGEDWVFFDCGANVGYYAILFARLAPKGRVYAFEPTSTHAMLLRNVEHAGVGNVVAERLALGRSGGVAEASIPRIWGFVTDRGSFPFTTVDDYAREHGISRVDCIKIDVDSYDFDVLQGAEKTLERFDPWLVIELTDVALTLRNHFATEVLGWLAARGYAEAVVLDPTNFALRRRGTGTAPGKSILLRFPG